MSNVARAKKACLEQLELIDELSECILNDFPLKVKLK
jgi:hypothetical protein